MSNEQRLTVSGPAINNTTSSDIFTYYAPCDGQCAYTYKNGTWVKE